MVRSIGRIIFCVVYKVKLMVSVVSIISDIGVCGWGGGSVVIVLGEGGVGMFM